MTASPESTRPVRGHSRRTGRPAGSAPRRGSTGLRAIGLLLVLGVSFAARAASVPHAPATGTATAADHAQAQIESFVRSHVGPEYRVELHFGELNPKLRLEACDRIEPFLSAGTRLWGRTTIGVRCVEGARWSVALPMTVAVFGPGLVASRPIAPGSPLSAEDVRIEEVELSAENRPALTDPAQVEGQMSTRALDSGQALRDYHVRILPTVRPGDPVRLRMIGPGFVVMTEGAAMAAAGNGQAVRVRTAGGKVMLGTVNGRTVDVKL